MKPQHLSIISAFLAATYVSANPLISEQSGLVARNIDEFPSQYIARDLITEEGAKIIARDIENPLTSASNYAKRGTPIHHTDQADKHHDKQREHNTAATQLHAAGKHDAAEHHEHAADRHAIAKEAHQTAARFEPHADVAHHAASMSKVAYVASAKANLHG